MSDADCLQQELGVASGDDFEDAMVDEPVPAFSNADRLVELPDLEPCGVCGETDEDLVWSPETAIMIIYCS